MSVTNTNKLRARVATLDKLLDGFDGELDDLLAKSLPETLLGLDTLQQAKLQVTIPYLVYDLVIIYLKTKGIDPKTHPVFRELERVRGYIEKVSKAEKQESEQQTERMTIDKAAANRFIKHAITQATRAQGQSSADPVDQEPSPGSSKVHVQPAPVGATNKMLARTEWEKQVREAAEEEEEDLEVFEETEGHAHTDADVEMINDKAPASTSLPAGTGETSKPQKKPVTTKKKKKSKQAKLPLTGAAATTIGTNPGTEGTDFSANPPFTPQLEIRTSTTTTDPTPAKVTGQKRPFPPSETPAGDSEDPSASASAPKNKKRKRNKKKQSAQMAVASGRETDGGTTSQSRSQSQSLSQSQSRDVSVASTPQVLTQPLPGVEADAAATGGDEKPRKWRKYNRKKKNANNQPAVEIGVPP